MIPILFDGTETQFTSNGIGRLSDAISCLVTENRNGAYELEMKYPIDGIHFSDIQLGRYIFAKPARYSNNQAFEVYQITRPINGVCTICAYHISYRLAKIPVMPFSTNSVTAALSGLVTNAAETNPFTFTTTKTTVANYNQTEPRDARSCLGGVQGSILDVFGGGDYEFDMFSVKLWANRGQDRGFQIRYGKNLTNIKQEESIENTITGICPFYKNDSTTVTLTEKVIETASASNFPYPRTVPVDLSSYFEDKVPTEAELRAKANAYIESHSIGVPKVSLDVSFVNLADMPGYEDIAVLEDIRLCDTVKVVFEKLGVSASAKVISTEYDTLKERFTKVGLGTPSTSLANTIAELDKKTEQQTSVVQSAIDRATNLITGVSGGYVVIHQDEDGKPYEILIMDNEDINSAQKVWRWNQAGWGYSSNGYNGTYALAATIDGEIVADFIKAGTITGIAINNGNGTFTVDSAGNLVASSATIKTQDSLGRTEITDGSLTTYSRSSGNKGIKINGSSLHVYSWNNDGNFVGAVGSTYESGTGAQSVAMWCDAGDRVLIGYKVSGSDGVYKSLEINHDNAGGIMCRKSMGIDNVPLNVWNGSGNFVGSLRRAVFGSSETILLECDYGDMLALGYRDANSSAHRALWINGATGALYLTNGYIDNRPVIGTNDPINQQEHGYSMMWVPQTSPYIQFFVDTVSVAQLQASYGSDKRLKKAVDNIENDLLNAIGSVDFIQFRYINEIFGNALRTGVIAQDVIEALEDAGISWQDGAIISKTKSEVKKDGELDEKSDEYYTVNYEQFLITRLAYDEKKMSKMEEEIELLKEEIRLLKGEK